MAQRWHGSMVSYPSFDPSTGIFTCDALILGELAIPLLRISTSKMAFEKERRKSGEISLLWFTCSLSLTPWQDGVKHFFFLNLAIH